MIELIEVFAAVLAMSGGSNGGVRPPSPPHNPNFCSGRVCVEAFPIPQPETKRFVKPEFEVLGSEARPVVKVKYKGLGAVILSFGEVPSDPSSVEDATKVGEICLEGAGCSEGSLYVSEIAERMQPEEIKCQIKRVWTMKADYRASADGRIGQEIDQTFQLRMASGRCTAQMPVVGRDR